MDSIFQWCFSRHVRTLSVLEAKSGSWFFLHKDGGVERLFGMVAMICKISSWEELVFCPDRLVMVRAVNASWSRLHAILVDLVIFEFSIFRKCMQHLQNGKGGDQEEDEEEEEEEDECLLGESGYSSTSYSGYSSSTRTESISPHSNTREEPASQVRSLGNTVARKDHNCTLPLHTHTALAHSTF